MGTRDENCLTYLAGGDGAFGAPCLPGAGLGGVLYCCDPLLQEVSQGSTRKGSAQEPKRQSLMAKRLLGGTVSSPMGAIPSPVSPGQNLLRWGIFFFVDHENLQVLLKTIPFGEKVMEIKKVRSVVTLTSSTLLENMEIVANYERYLNNIKKR
ncbi:hypothetical protein CHS0354_024884 [Potamilus streckersoni]|uniref:Uncharacterized protein n=1 Tax=Potamilus streckersoni TaxID=2493646 RepID=A0AAE0TFC8_9BIVA|nr:hypothetical protein CHS0354_024884 [Potamilus streckersoni]